jgi:hypothetical protein
MSRIKNVNTNTNINRININVPRQYRPRQPKKKTVAQAEEALSQDENQDRQASYQSQGISINPNVYGFNTSPINREVGIVETRPETRTAQTQTQITKGRSMGTSTRNMSTEPMETQTESISSESPRMAVAEPIPFRSTSVPVNKGTLALGYSEPQYSLNIPSDFQDRLSRQEGFQPSSHSSSYAPLYSNRMRDINKQGRADINMMARNVREAYRGKQEEQIVPFTKQLGTSSSYQQPIAFENVPLEEALPPAKKGKGGRPVGSKNKPKPQKTEMITQTGESLNPREPIATQTTPRPKKALRGKRLINMEEID